MPIVSSLAALAALGATTIQPPSYTFANRDNNNVEFTPDEKSVVFVTEDEDSPVGDIWIIEIETRKARLLGRGNDPSFSHDGSKIAFIDIPEGEEDSEVFIMDADGSNRKRITNDDLVQFDPSFDAANQRIAFMAADSEDFETAGVFIVPAAGGTPKRLTPAGAAAFSPTFDSTDPIILFTSTTEAGASISGIYFNTPEDFEINVIRETDEATDYFLPACSAKGNWWAWEKMTADGSTIESAYVGPEDSAADPGNFGTFAFIQCLDIDSTGKRIVASVKEDEDSPTRIALVESGKPPVFLTNGG